MAKRWADQGLITALRPHGENSAIVSILTQENGRHKGFVRLSRGNRSLIQQGNLVHARWNARVEGALGNWTLEPLHAYAPGLFNLRGPLHALNTACHWIELALPEREPNPDIFAHFIVFLAKLSTPAWRSAFVHFEVALLKTLGAGLDFSQCAVTGQQRDLTYVSPRTGRAVTAAVGAPYHDQLLALPAFLGQICEAPSHADVVQGLELTRYFFERHLCDAGHGRLPHWRAQIYEELSVSTAALDF